MRAFSIRLMPFSNSRQANPPFFSNSNLFPSLTFLSRPAYFEEPIISSIHTLPIRLERCSKKKTQLISTQKVEPSFQIDGRAAHQKRTGRSVPVYNHNVFLICTNMTRRKENNVVCTRVNLVDECNFV